jgi:hypothetical protein
MSNVISEAVDNLASETDFPTLSEHRRMAGLLGFLTKAEVDGIFRQHPFSTVEGGDPLILWRDFDHRRQLLPTIQDAEPLPLPESLKDIEAGVRQGNTYKHFYECVADYAFASVPITSLLTPQWYCDLDYVEELAGQISGLSERDLLRFALTEGKINQPIVAGGQVLFTSRRRDLHADPVPSVRQVADGEFEIVTRALSRPNYIQVARIGRRLFLTNGVHKVCALYKAGYTHCYCLSRDVHELSETESICKRVCFVMQFSRAIGLLPWSIS